MRGCVDELIADLCVQVDADPTDVLALTVVGNPIMHHLFLGLDPTELGGAPFALATDGAVHRRAADLDLHVHPGARVYVLPCIAGHVGADTAGVILSEAPYQQEIVNLIVDVGTNAEIVLGNRDRMLAASSPTGPAFEGAQISCGQRAAPGAIERVRIDEQTLEPRFTVIGDDRWSDEPGFDASKVTGVCGSGIIEVVAEMFLAGILTTDGVIDGALAARTPRVVPDGRTFSYVLHDGEPRLVITQNDVRQIQLAKAALYAGCRLLMDHLGIDTVDRIRLAGAFGAHIDPVHALVLGLVPDCDPAHVTSAGNAAGTGARIALLNRAARAEIEDVVRRVEKIETALEPRFQEHFVGAMGIPHTTEPSPRLATVVPLPAPELGRRHRATNAAAAGATRRPRPARTRGAPHERHRHETADRGTTDGRGRRTGGPRRPAGRARRRRARSDPLHHPDAPAVRGADRKKGSRSIEQNADTILEQVGIDFRDAPDALELLKGGRRRRAGRARAVPARDVPPDHPGDGAASASRSTRATPRTTSRSAACTPCSRRRTARRSCATWTAAGATARSRTSATS